MFRNYLKIGLRSMIKNWSTSFINIAGLSLAIACFITIWIFIDLQLNMDGFHSRKEDIYQVIMKVDTENGIEQWGDTPYPLARMIAQDQAAVEGFFRLEFQYANVRYKKSVFQEFMVFTDPGYLDHLDFDILSGDPNALRSVDQMVISSNTATKYFGDEDPLGKQLTLKFNEGKTKTFTVGAVLKEYPHNNSLNYSFLLPISQFEQLELAESNGWDYLADANFIVLREGYSGDQLASQLDQYREVFNSAAEGTTSVGYRLIPLSKLSASGFEIIGAIANFSNPAARVSLITIVTLLTLLASFNYMNISVSAATKRLKEIGIRKVMGSYKKQIVYQFLTENILQVSFAMLLGTLMCYFLLLPGFNTLIPISIPFHFSSIKSIAGLFGGLLLFVGVVSGAYPSLYISRFMPIDIFRGNSRFGDKSVFSNVLLGFQLVIAFLTIVGCFMFADNAIHQRNIDWGYENQNMISVRTNNAEEFAKFRDRVISLPGVDEFVSGENHAGRSYAPVITKQLEKEIRTNWMKVAPDYPDKLNMKLNEGSFFSKEIDRNNNREALVDPLFSQRMGWDNPIGQQITVESVGYTVVGELQPFVIEQWHAYGERTPTLITVNPEEKDKYLIVKTASSDIYAFDEALEEAWLEVSPNDPYTGAIQANVFDDFYRETKTNVTIIVFIAIVSTVLACLGLFGLLSFNIQRRLKELSVRKVLGASRGSIIKLISLKYRWVLLVSFTVGGIMGYYLMMQMINGIYSDPKTNYVLPVFLAAVIMAATIGSTIAGQIMKATRVNPSVNLRAE
jgi:putative ABC transport system permease protein